MFMILQLATRALAYNGLFHSNSLRNTMQESRLSGLEMLYIHRDISCEVDNVVDTLEFCEVVSKTDAVSELMR